MNKQIQEFLKHGELPDEWGIEDKQNTQVILFSDSYYQIYEYDGIQYVLIGYNDGDGDKFQCDVYVDYMGNEHGHDYGCPCCIPPDPEKVTGYEFQKVSITT